jgi:hypothetical protein
MFMFYTLHSHMRGVSRVTSLGAFSPIGQLFTSGSIFLSCRNNGHFWGYFFHGTSNVSILRKKWVTFWATFCKLIWSPWASFCWVVKTRSQDCFLHFSSEWSPMNWMKTFPLWSEFLNFWSDHDTEQTEYRSQRTCVPVSSYFYLKTLPPSHLSRSIIFLICKCKYKAVETRNDIANDLDFGALSYVNVASTWTWMRKFRYIKYSVWFFTAIW